MRDSRRQFLLKAASLGSVAALRPTDRAEAQTPNAFDYKRNWGRWGNDDQKGAVNLITPAKRIEAARLVRSGRAVSLSRVFTPPQHYIRVNSDRGSVADYYGFEYHGVAFTHMDALSHMWDRNGMWQGRDPSKEMDSFGVTFADITAFGDGLFTRGVLLDVAKHRGTPYVVPGQPVTGQALETIAKATGVAIGPGDALLVHCGREAFTRGGRTYGGATEGRPGFDSSCARFIRDHDVAVFVWDMHDALPDPGGHRWPLHGVLYSHGVPARRTMSYGRWHCSMAASS